MAAATAKQRVYKKDKKLNRYHCRLYIGIYEHRVVEMIWTE